MSASSGHVIVLPGGGYAEHAANEGEPIAQWLQGFGVAASAFHYPLMARHPARSMLCAPRSVVCERPARSKSV